MRHRWGAKVMDRRTFLLGVMLPFLIAHRLDQRNTPSTRQAQPRRVLGSIFRKCDYEYVRTDKNGVITDHIQASANCFDESLGGGVTLTMVEIPEGDFIMGSPADEAGHKPDEEPQHKVHVPRFFMGDLEVSEEQYEAMRRRPRVKRKLGYSLSAYIGRTRPKVSADGISWDWATEFCHRLAVLTGKPYRLPSEAEWEYAARAGTNTAYGFGPVFTPTLVYNSQLRALGNPGSAEGGSSGPANAFGLKDMEGNVSEWVLDSYHPNYIGAPVDGSPWFDANDPKGADLHKERVLRGGDYANRIEFLRSAARLHWPSSGFSVSGHGFRVALTLSE